LRACLTGALVPNRLANLEQPEKSFAAAPISASFHSNKK
jgi:hypothetical protein